MQGTMKVCALPCQPVISLSGILPDIGRLVQESCFAKGTRRAVLKRIHTPQKGHCSKAPAQHLMMQFVFISGLLSLKPDGDKGAPA